MTLFVMLGHDFRFVVKRRLRVGEKKATGEELAPSGGVWCVKQRPLVMFGM